MRMPKPDADLLNRRQVVLNDLRRILPANGKVGSHRDDGQERVISDPELLKPYDSDGLIVYRQVPYAVLIPETLEEVSEILCYCHNTGLKVVPRGSGTSLSGGALPLADGIVLSMARFDRIHSLDPINRTARVGPGVTNLSISAAARHLGLHYAPDPSSQVVCSIGGNVAENSGGVHCLKYGLTTHNITGLEAVLITGEVIRLGGEYLDGDGLDLLGLMTGSEGLLAVITEITVRLVPSPRTAQAMLAGFDSEESAGNAVSDVIRAGIIPAGLEMMDTISVEAVEAYMDSGYPKDAAALLICELDGLESEVSELTLQVEDIFRKAGATSIKRSQSEEERLRFWTGRKESFPALGRLTPDTYCMDGTIPRRRLAKTLNGIRRISKAYGLRVANVFHAGDGNLHPLILFDASKPGELEATEAMGAEILKLCVDMGGVLSGEHGVGVEKRDLMPLMFSENELNQQQRIKCAFDPKHLLNPGKMFPKLHRCAELSQMHIHKGQVPFPDIPRF